MFTSDREVRGVSGCVEIAWSGREVRVVSGCVEIAWSGREGKGVSDCVEGAWSGREVRVVSGCVEVSLVRQREERCVHIGIKVHTAIVCNEVVRILSPGYIVQLTEVIVDVIIY